MLRKNRLFTPGPTPILPAAQTAMASFAMHHRTADFRALFSRVLADIKLFIGTNNDVLVLTASGTGAMEGAVSNLTSPGDKVLVLSAGKFGERWRDLAKAFGCEVEILSAPYGETFSLDEIRHAAIANPPDDPIRHQSYRDAKGLRPGGFGVLLTKSLVDEVIYSEKGNEVLLVKYTESAWQRRA